jgi:exosortase O
MATRNNLFTVRGHLAALRNLQASQRIAAALQRRRDVLANLVLMAAWLYLYRGVYPYLGVIFTQEEFRTNQIILLGALALIALQIKKGEFNLSLNSLPQRYLPAAALALGCSALYLFAEHFLDINTLSATLFGLGSYGLLGLWMSPHRWRHGMPAALLLVGALPFGEHMQTFIGYPVRVMTARIVQEGLSALGVHSLGVDTILVFENGISKVDLPCSGVKSLWTGGLFFLAATWIERRTINLRWVLASLGFAVSLLVANLVRVAILVSVGQVAVERSQAASAGVATTSLVSPANLRLLAEMLHVPLGVIGFILACLLGLLLLRWSEIARVSPTRVALQAQAPQSAQLSKPAGEAMLDLRDQPGRTLERPAWLSFALVGAVLLMALLYSPRPAQPQPESQLVYQFPDELGAKPWALTPEEQDWLKRSGVESAERWRFEWRGLQGSMLFVASTTWRAHHRPETCFEVYGLTVEEARSALVSPDFPVRLLTLGSGKQKELLSAAYWLQSPTQVTEDYATRIWADLAPERQDWVLVTILFDAQPDFRQPVDPSSTSAQALYTALRNAVSRSLAGVEYHDR